MTVDEAQCVDRLGAKYYFEHGSSEKVQAFEVTSDNVDQVAEWCDAKVTAGHVMGEGARYFLDRAHTLNWAKEGNWIVQNLDGRFRSFLPQYFKIQFTPVESKGEEEVTKLEDEKESNDAPLNTLYGTYLDKAGQMVRASRVTKSNISKIAQWAGGRVSTGSSEIISRPPATTWAEVGDWVIRHDNGTFDVMTERGFNVVYLQHTDPIKFFGTPEGEEVARREFDAEKDAKANSGEVRTTSTTGAQKGVKPERFDLIPVPALTQIARLYGKGAEKYAEHNWRHGYEWSKSYAAMQRHAQQFWAGEDIDEEMGLPHLASVAFHAFALLTFMEEHPEFDDRFKVAFKEVKDMHDPLGAFNLKGEKDG